MHLNPYYPFYYLQYIGQAYLALERYEDAIEALMQTTTRNPEALTAHVYLAACYGLLGKDAPASEALGEAQGIYPDFSADWVRTFMPYKRQTDSNRLIKGLRKAGLAE